MTVPGTSPIEGMCVDSWVVSFDALGTCHPPSTTSGGPVPTKKLWSAAPPVAVAAALSLGAATVLVSTATAHADVGDCVTVKGSKGKGSAKVCLVRFDGEAKGSARLKVSKQKKGKAPNNVYVSVGFLYGGFNDGWRRLGDNSPASYTKTQKASAAYPEKVRVRLCYDKSGREDPCYTSKVLDPGWVGF